MIKQAHSLSINKMIIELYLNFQVRMNAKYKELLREGHLRRQYFNLFSNYLNIYSISMMKL